MAVAFEDQQVSDQMVEERAVMRDDNRATTEPFQFHFDGGTPGDVT